MRLAAQGISVEVREGGDHVRRVLDDVSLEVSPGELVVLAGPSGSGKTTLLGTLVGLVTPTRGDVELDGRSLVGLREHARARLRRTRVGLVLQELLLVPELSALDNVLLPLVPDGVSPAAESRALRALARFGLEPRAASRVSTLSGGERQRVAIARALVTDATLLVLDEPTAHVDLETAAALLDTLVALRDEGRAVLVSSHDPRVLDDPRVNRVVRLDRGRRVAP